jgi:hypothetical protein
MSTVQKRPPLPVKKPVFFRSGCTRLADKQLFYKTPIKEKVPPATNLVHKCGQRRGNADTETVTPRKCTIHWDAAHVIETEGSMETLRMKSRRKWFLAQLESLRMERLRMERRRKTFSPNWNHSEWKDSEWKDSETP